MSAADGAISAADVRQGSLPTCYFLAVLSALAHVPKGRVFLASMLYALPDAPEIAVRFFAPRRSSGQAKPIWVATSSRLPAKIEGERKLLYAQSEETDGPVWAAVLEKAWALYQPLLGREATYESIASRTDIAAGEAALAHNTGAAASAILGNAGVTYRRVVDPPRWVKYLA